MIICETCHKEFNSDAEYENHLFMVRNNLICAVCHSDDIYSVDKLGVSHVMCRKCGYETCI